MDQSEKSNKSQNISNPFIFMNICIPLEFISDGLRVLPLEYERKLLMNQNSLIKVNEGNIFFYDPIRDGCKYTRNWFECIIQSC